jgi:hypothetical protein
VNALAYFAGSRIDDLLIAAGELTWHAGPLVKGGGLCHGIGQAVTRAALWRLMLPRLRPQAGAD